MKNGNPKLNSIWASLEREPVVNLHRWPVRLDLGEDDMLRVTGEVDSVAAKRRVLDIAWGSTEVRGVVDELHVAPSVRKGDGAILDAVASTLQAAPDLRNCTLRILKKEQTRTLRESNADSACGDVLLAVKDGVVSLDGWIISLSHKRLAEVLAWWVPGCRDVHNDLDVMPPELDNDDEVSDALSLVLEIDPMIPRPDHIHVQTRNHVVTLEGLVGSEAEKNRAEQDAWCLFAVEGVVNRLAVGTPAPG